MGWGDEIIVTGIVRRLQEKVRCRVRVLDKKGRPRWSRIWDHNARFAPPGWKGDVQTTTNGPGRRSYIRQETATRWVWREWVCPVGEIHLSGSERAFGARHPGRIVLEPNLSGKASPNKDWGWQRWTELARLLRDGGHRVTQLGPPGTRLLPGAELLLTAGFREACAVLEGARLAILPEGGLHHAAAALGVPTVVIFGGYISPRQTGYAHQVSLFTGGEPCGMRAPCAHCARAMKRIAPERVLADALALMAVRCLD
jgi:hypothetical protein